MVQSWNKLCYKGGHLEASISLPGRGDVSGFWPGFWTMGNLARPGYLGSTEGLWPYSYHDKCDVGITPNQSSYDGLSFLPGMKLPACTCKGEDHPSPGKSRSAPEIDALEGSVHFLGPGETNAVGVVSQSFQAAPFDVWYMPDYGEHLDNPKSTLLMPLRLHGSLQQSNHYAKCIQGRAFPTSEFCTDQLKHRLVRREAVSAILIRVQDRQ